MSIDWDPVTREFHLRNDRMSYLMRILENDTLGQMHFGAALARGRSYNHLSRGAFTGFSNRLDDPIALEYPTPGIGDYRVPALTLEQSDGSTVLDLRYVGHRIYDGKDAISGLPSTYVERDDEAETLEVLLADGPSGVEARLSYTVFRHFPAIARHVRITNGGTGPVQLRGAMSASLDLPDSEWDAIQLDGAWAREGHVTLRRLASGRQSISSTRGVSSHQHNPFLVLKRPDTTEEQGVAYGFSLVYSGNFIVEAEVGTFATTRVRLGINPEGFSWSLPPGADFVTPEAVLVYADAGLGDLSLTYHGLYRERLAAGAWRDRPRPVVINNWEATYFQFTEERLLELASHAQRAGIELFVLDDGWFGRRDDATSSLGDWVVDRRKLPDGIDGLAHKIEALGMKFGLWIEPEMVNPRSELFAGHPDWAVGVPGRSRTEGRNQYVLDMSRPEVVDHLFQVLSRLLGDAPISYVKWDMNRHITEPYSLALPAERQGEFFHRYVLGVYELYRRLTTAFPDVLFESCASGGGRFDPGLLAFAPQAWTSDDTDAVERLKIQWGMSLCYPLSAIVAHVSAVPNHQVGRITPLATRAAVAYFGVLGYELDLTVLSDEEREAIADQVVFYKDRRELFQRGRFLRLRSPFDGDGNEAAWMVVAENARRAVVGHYRVLNRPSPGPARLRLRGLDPAAAYRISAWPVRDDAIERANAGVRGGDELMHVGLVVETVDPAGRRRGDFQAHIFDLEAL